MGGRGYVEVICGEDPMSSRGDDVSAAARKALERWNERVCAKVVRERGGIKKIGKNICDVQ